MKLAVTFLVSLISLAWAGIPVAISDDPWYNAPANLDSLADGTIIRSRETPNSLAALVLFPQNVQKSYQLLYKSTDDLNRTFATATTIIVPYNADYTKLVSFQIAEDSAYINCAPSYALQFASDPDALLSQVEFVFLSAMLSLGYVVNVPDYEGPRSAFTVGQVAGRAVLDSLRAALASSSITGINSKARIALWGYSGGSLASGWAAQLQPSHAPELVISGAALGGVVPNIAAVATKVSGGVFAGLVPAGITGFGNQYDEVSEIISAHLVPSKVEEWNKANSQCIVADALGYAFQDIFEDYFTIGTGILEVPEVAARLNQNLMGSLVPEFPIYIYHAVGDEVAPVEKADTLVSSWCNAGIKSLEYHKDILDEHLSEEVFGSAGAIVWLKSIMEDSADLADGCKTEISLSQLIDPDAVPVLGEELVQVLLNLVGKPIGPISFA